MKLKLLISLLAALYVQQNWAERVVSDTAFMNASVQEERQLLAAQIAEVVCSPSNFPEYKELASDAIALELLKKFSSSVELGRYINQTKKQLNNPQLVFDCRELPEKFVFPLSSAVKKHFGEEYFQTVSRDDKLLGEILARTLRQQIEQDVASFEIVVDADAVSSARFKGFLVTFLLSAFVLILGRTMVLFFYYFIASKEQAKTLPEISIQAKEAWQKATSAGSVENNQKQGE